jgi:hypothetical protein
MMKRKLMAASIADIDGVPLNRYLDSLIEADGLCREAFGGIPLAKMLAMAVYQVTHENGASLN